MKIAKSFLVGWVAGAFLFGSPALQLQAQSVPKRPNILFLFMDDLTWWAIHALGNQEVQTPHIDRLFKEGTIFSNAYIMGAWHGAVCVASRTCLNTGLAVWDAHAAEPRLNQWAREGKFWAQLLHKAGYETYMTGKWHVRANITNVFDHVRHVRPGMPRSVPSAYNRPIEGKPDPWKPWDKSLGGYWQGGTHWSVVTANDACSFLEQAAGKSRPFFLYVAFNAPHDPRQSPKEYVERYSIDKISLPPNFMPEYPYKDAMGCGKSLRDERLAPFPRTPYAIRVHRREYYAIITHADDQIGRILDTLRRLHLEKNTLIIFTADNGLAIGCHGLMGKQSMFEHSVRVPLTLYGPGIPKGKRIDTPVYMQDIMPTTLEWAGVPIPSWVVYRSLMPLIRGERQVQYPTIYAAYRPDRQRMVRQGDYKLIWYPPIDKYLLFDLKHDPWETRDLAREPSMQSRLHALQQTLRQLEKRYHDPLLQSDQPSQSKSTKRSKPRRRKARSQ